MIFFFYVLIDSDLHPGAIIGLAIPDHVDRSIANLDGTSQFSDLGFWKSTITRSGLVPLKTVYSKGADPSITTREPGPETVTSIF